MIKINDLTPKAESVLTKMKQKHEVKTNARAVIKALEELADILNILENAEALTKKGGD